MWLFLPQIQEFARSKSQPTPAQMAEIVRLNRHMYAPPVPVPVFEIVQKHLMIALDITEVPMDIPYPEEVAGVAYAADGNDPTPPYNKRARISIRSGIDPGEQRFAIAHMLGHLVLHTMDEIYGRRPLHKHVYSRVADDEREKAANEFAAHLLVPLPLLESAAAKSGSSDEVAKTFNVPPSVIHWQVEKLL